MAERTLLQRARRDHGWSADSAVRRLIGLARIEGVSVASRSSLITQLSRWENGRPVEDERYQRLFCQLYGRTRAELGFDEDKVDESVEELRARLHVARTVDGPTVALFRAQVEAARRVDRRFGAVTQLEAVRAQMADVERLLRFGVTASERPALAGALVEAATLAGWEALDRAALRAAWDHHEVALLAAREAESPALLAHAMAQQAMVLVDLGEAEIAVDRVVEARKLAGGSVSHLLSAWLAAAEGEIRAAAGDPSGALRAFDDADGLIPPEPQDPDLPFLFLADGHLDRWRGHVLAQVGDERAIEQLEGVLERLPSDFVRARASTLVDLAVATAAAGDRDGALHYSSEARLVAGRVASTRQLRRLGRLRLPT
jgi:tetratricopeptide (TPR) repeat protein